MPIIDTPWQGDAAAALETLRSRGTDESAIAWLPGAVLGHARLAVIDVNGGRQPMLTPDGRYTLVFNGEIYNYVQLRDELAALGHKFSTHSDTETLLYDYAQWGGAVVERLDGMFAFAVWDSAERTLFAARDRLGIKPLFYSSAAGFALASTPRVI